MQRLRRSALFVFAAVIVALSLNASPRETKAREPRNRDKQEKASEPRPWTRLIRQLLDDVIPPPDNRGSVPPG